MAKRFKDLDGGIFGHDAVNSRAVGYFFQQISCDSCSRRADRGAMFVPGYEASAWQGIGAPKNTPAEIVDKLKEEINAALADSKMKAGSPVWCFWVRPPTSAPIAADTERWDPSQPGLRSSRERSARGDNGGDFQSRWLKRWAWIGGQGNEPYEQNTQQSPGFGFSWVPQPLHS